MSSQFYLYILVFTPTFVSPIKARIGAKWVAFLGALGPCLLSAITPLVTRFYGAIGLILVRTFMGAFHGCIYGSLISMYLNWFPLHERTNANCGLLIGSALGSALMFSLTGWLCQTSIGWPLVFYVNAALHLPWMFLWLYCATDDPSECPHVCDSELKYIRQYVTPGPMPGYGPRKRSAPWFTVLSSIPVLCSLLTKLAVGCCYFFLVTELPTYMSRILGVSILHNGFFNALASLGQGLLLAFSSPLSNWIIRKTTDHIRAITIRKIFQSVSMLFPAICLALVPLMGCNCSLIMGLLFFAMMLSGATTGGEWTCTSEYAPNSASVIYAFSGVSFSIAAIIVPHLLGVLLDTLDEQLVWNVVFIGTAIVLLIGGGVFVVLGTNTAQSWDRLDSQMTNNHSVASNTDLDKTIRKDNISIASIEP